MNQREMQERLNAISDAIDALMEEAGRDASLVIAAGQMNFGLRVEFVNGNDVARAVLHPHVDNGGFALPTGQNWPMWDSLYAAKGRCR